MKRITLLLFALALAVAWLAARRQTMPGYMDADYYFMGGTLLAQGAGFSEPVLWNYLDDPQGLPHPSHAYWMPLASLVAAVGLRLFPVGGFEAARTGFILAAALVPPLTAFLAYTLYDRQPPARRRRAGLLAGLLAVFSGYYLRFMATTDTFGLYMLLGGLFCLVLATEWRRRPLGLLGLGFLAGGMHLARTEGILWLLPALYSAYRLQACRDRVLLPLAGYLLVMGPWLLRNWQVFGSPLAPGGGAALWFTEYEQLFAYPAASVTPAVWWAAGPGNLLLDRLAAGWVNLQSAIAVQGSIFLFPLMVSGGRQQIGRQVVRLGSWMWLLLFALMTLVFPFAGARGGYFHAAAALQPLLWALAPAGLDAFLSWGARVRGWVAGQAGTVFGASLVGLSLLVSLFLLGMHTETAASGKTVHQEMDAALQDAGARPEEIVMVNNPPGYYNQTGRMAIVIPHGGEAAILAAARQYGARWLVLEEGQGLPSLYDHPGSQPGLRYLEDIGGARLFEVLP